MRGWSLVLLVLASVASGIAQSSVNPRIDPLERTRPTLPDFDPLPWTPGITLPPVPPPTTPGIKRLFTEIHVLVRHVRVKGNTVLPQKVVNTITADYEGKQLSFADLERLRDRLTVEYIRRGFVTSGAVIPDQTIQDGVVEVQMVEGKLGAVKAKTHGRLKQSYISDRLQLRKSRIVNVYEIEEALQLLRQDTRVETLSAELVPTEERGESRLSLEVQEARGRREVLRLNNYQPLSVGSAGGDVSFAHGNLSGSGDTFSGSFRGTHGLRDMDMSYSVPLNAADTTLSLHGSVARSEVVQQPFAKLDIKSSMESYGIVLLQPVHRTRQSEFGVSLAGELRRSQSFLLGYGFRFTDDLTEDGVARVSVVRFGQSWTRRGIGQAFAMRSSLAIGLNIFGATHPAGSSGTHFVAWLGQFQWAHRIKALGAEAQLILRGDAQFADSPLPGLERFAVGGRETVRGYHENELVRDNGMIGSSEARIPVLKLGDQAMVLEVAPFADFARSWNTNQPLLQAETLPSAGVGLRLRNRNRLQAEIYWGHAFRDVGAPGKWSLQDSGVHVGLVWSLP